MALIAPLVTGTMERMQPISAPNLHPTVRWKSPEILTPGQPFSEVELRAMANDGVLQRIIPDVYAPSAARPTPDLRSAALATGLTSRLVRRTVVGRLSAAWIFGCAPAPAAPVLLVPAPRRLSAAGRGHGVLLHEVFLGEFDVIEVGALSVTTPLRTVVDVAVHGEGALAALVVRRLVAQPGLGLTLSLVSRAVDALPRQPNKQRAKEVLRRLAMAER
ncbi:hypothetical protein [Sinomonas sp.]|uniref:hypothetical protein n=1 Tax=Sinomonas sp. TaxID=1914986 RepID=UPI003F7D8EFF